MKFTECVWTLRRWFAQHNMLPDRGRIRVMIEVPTPEVACEVLYQLKSEFDMTAPPIGARIDIGEPIEIMGVEFTFRLPEKRRMPRHFVRMPDILKHMPWSG